MPYYETPEAGRKKRLQEYTKRKNRADERKRVDTYMRERRKAGAKPGGKKQATASEKAAQRRKAILEKTAPSGWMRLLKALGLE